MAKKSLLESIQPAPPEAVMRLFDDVAAKRDAIDGDKRFTLEARQDQWETLRTEAHQRLNAEVDALTAADEQAIDNEKGQIVAALKNTPPSLPLAATGDELLKIVIRQQHESQRLARRALEVQRAERATAATAVHVFEAAEVSGDDELVRDVGDVLVERLRAATMRHSAETRHSTPEFAALVDVQGRFEKFTAAHPSPIERLRKLEDRRKVVRRTWADAKATWLRVVKWDEDIVPAAPTLTRKAS